MKIVKIPTYWTAEQAATIVEFLGELQGAVWEKYESAIQQMNDEIRVNQTQVFINEKPEDDIEF